MLVLVRWEVVAFYLTFAQFTTLRLSADLFLLRKFPTCEISQKYLVVKADSTDDLERLLMCSFTPVLEEGTLMRA